MTLRILPLLFLSALLIGCAANGSSIENARTKYKNTKNYQSLETIFKHLSKEMSRKDTESLLGEPDYSPIAGQYYYSSAQLTFSKEQNRDVPLGLVIDYRDKDGTIKDTLQEYWLGPIGE